MNKKVIDIIKQLIKENDNILNVRGGRGYGVGHPYAVKQIKPLLGNNDFEDTNDEDNKNVKSKVKISKAFKQR